MNTNKRQHPAVTASPAIISCCASEKHIIIIALGIHVAES
jgi:hypothetical protein